MKLFFKLIPFFIFTLLLASCEHEPEFVHDSPVSLKSWLDYSDSDYCSGTFGLNNSNGPLIVRSNFDLLSDTQWSFMVKIPKKSPVNSKGIDFLGFKIMNSSVGIFLDSASFTSKIMQTSSGQFNALQTRIIPSNFKITSKNNDFFEFNGKVKVYYESTFFPLDSVEMSFTNILVEKSYVRVWVNGGIVSPFSWDIDLKAGNEYNPEPTISIMPEFGKIIQIGLGLIDGKKKYEILPAEKQFTNLKNAGQTWTPSSGYFLFDKFYYKDIVKANLRINYQSPDKSKTYTVDSVKINYSRIPF